MSLHPTVVPPGLCRFVAVRPGSGDQGGLKTCRLCLRALKESVDVWPVAIIIPRHSGVNRSRYPWRAVSCFTAWRRTHVIGRWYSPAEGRMVQCGPAFSVANPHVCLGPSLGETQWGQLDGPGGPKWLRPQGLSGLGIGLRSFPRPCKYPDHSFGGGV